MATTTDNKQKAAHDLSQQTGFRSAMVEMLTDLGTDKVVKVGPKYSVVGINKTKTYFTLVGGAEVHFHKVFETGHAPEVAKMTEREKKIAGK